jgi:uncharacterized protein (DUF488 family)
MVQMATEPVLFTIGFTGKSAEKFFRLLTEHNVRRVIDTRASNTSQLAGFAKGRDLAFFCREIAGIEYEHRLDMAPTTALLKQYRNGHISWEEYVTAYKGLLEERELFSKVDLRLLDHACMLCSEHKPDRCHRRILAEYLQECGAPHIIRHLY